MKIQDSLTGRTVVGIDVCDDEEALRFRCEEGDPVVWAVFGDCCSMSYWHEGLALNSLRGATVTAVHELELPTHGLPEVDNGETIQVYGFAVVTNRGVATLVFRNESNGYYGGWAEVRDDLKTYRWRAIVRNDWQAGTASDPPSLTPEELAAAAAEAAHEAAEQFRDQVINGMVECRRQIRTAVPALTEFPPVGVMGRFADAVIDLQCLPTIEILVLGVYLKRIAEETLQIQPSPAA